MTWYERDGGNRIALDPPDPTTQHGFHRSRKEEVFRVVRHQLFFQHGGDDAYAMPLIGQINVKRPEVFRD
jgi:hypothetical protein